MFQSSSDYVLPVPFHITYTKLITLSVVIFVNKSLPLALCPVIAMLGSARTTHPVWFKTIYRQRGLTNVIRLMVSKISIRIDTYRYFQNIDPLFNTFKMSIRIKKFWRKVGNTLYKFWDILKGNFVTFYINFWKNLWKIIQKTWNYFEKSLKLPGEIIK